MLSQAVDHTWDLSPVIDLIYSLSRKGEPLIVHDDTPLPTLVESTERLVQDGNDTQKQLGNFDKLWDFLGQPLDVPPPVVQPTTPAFGSSAPDEGWCSPAGHEAEYTLAKAVRWRDEFQGANLEDKLDPSIVVAASRLSKRKKKSKRKQRSEVLAEELRQIVSGGLPAIGVSSEEESDKVEEQLPRPSDRRSVIYDILYGTKHNGGGSIIYRPSSLPISLVKNNTNPDLGGWPVSRSGQHSSRGQPEHQRVLSAVAKKAKLILELRQRFPAERDCISSLGTSQNVHVNGLPACSAIHVFVDVSNIMIGFHDSLKHLSGMPISTRIPRVPFSFHNFSLVLERGRPTAKRVLVGSDKYPAIDEAKQIGYETNILDRVHKAKELTPRQKRYLNGNGISGQSSGSETTAVFAPQKWVEQAVDEILHLKMMESIIDSKEPSTMVLATGDAAEAEYSQGFLRMVERALEKGWKVELVSFKHNTSGAYKKGDFRSRWGKMFTIIELDDYTEELMAV